jgi:hypothetical protein
MLLYYTKIYTEVWWKIWNIRMKVDTMTGVEEDFWIGIVSIWFRIKCRIVEELLKFVFINIELVM